MPAVLVLILLPLLVPLLYRRSKNSVSEGMQDTLRAGFLDKSLGLSVRSRSRSRSQMESLFVG